MRHERPALDQVLDREEDDLRLTGSFVEPGEDFTVALERADREADKHPAFFPAQRSHGGRVTERVAG